MVFPLSKEVVDPLSLTVVVMYHSVKCIYLAHHSGTCDHLKIAKIKAKQLSVFMFKGLIRYTDVVKIMKLR